MMSSKRIIPIGLPLYFCRIVTMITRWYNYSDLCNSFFLLSWVSSRTILNVNINYKKFISTEKCVSLYPIC